MIGESFATTERAATVAVPVVRSTRRHLSSRLSACMGMAIAYVRGDERGSRYRDLIELCLRDHPVSVDTTLAMARRLFPDVPMSDYGSDEMELDDVVMLARLAAQRGGRVLPLLAFDERFQPVVEVTHLHAIVLSHFSADPSGRRAFFDPEPAEIGGWRMSSRVEVVPPGFQTLVFGWLPPARVAHASERVTALAR